MQSNASTAASAAFAAKYPLWNAELFLAWRNLDADPATSLVKLRRFAEQFAQRLAEHGSVDIAYAETFADVLNLLRDSRQYDARLIDDLHKLRQAGNAGAHEEEVSSHVARDCFSLAFNMVRWYLQRFDSSCPPPRFRQRSSSQSAEPEEPATSKDSEATPEGLIRELGGAVASHLSSIEESPQLVVERVNAAVARIETSREPFRLGFVGEFRSGKSTLINAIAGATLAYVAASEATPVECVFRYGDHRRAFVVRVGNERQMLDCDEVNNLLAQHRHDVEWLSEIVRIEYEYPCQLLQELEPWDAPGLGGSGHNESASNDFIQRVGGAVWVFDVTLLGNASLDGPIHNLKRAGKRMIAVLNRADELSANEVEQAKQYLSELYPGVFECIHALSAKSAFDRAAAGSTSSDLQSLIQDIRKHLTRTAPEDRERRIRMAAAQASFDVASAVEEKRELLRDRLGLLAHLEHNLTAARRRLLGRIPRIVDVSVDDLLRGACVDTLKRLNTELYGEGEGGARNARRSAAVAKALEVYNRHPDVNSACQRVTRRVLEKSEIAWNQECTEAIQLSAAAIPEVTLPVPPAAANVESQVVQHESRIEDASLVSGLSVGGTAAVIAGTIAAISTVVTWPVVLVALPIGFLAAWKKHSELLAHFGWSDCADPVGEVQNALEQHRIQLRSALLQQIPDQIDSMLQTQISGILETASSQLFGRHTRERIQAVHSAMTDAAERLTTFGRRLCERGQMLSHYDPYAHPIVITTDAAGEGRWEQMVGRIHGRLDVVTPGVPSRLQHVLRYLNPDASIRLLALSTEEQLRQSEATLRAAFGRWPGNYSAAIAWVDAGGVIPLEQTLLITAKHALVWPGCVDEVLARPVHMCDFADGRLAAERLFAGLWEGKSSVYGRLNVRRV